MTNKHMAVAEAIREFIYIESDCVSARIVFCKRSAAQLIAEHVESETKRLREALEIISKGEPYLVSDSTIEIAQKALNKGEE